MIAWFLAQLPTTTPLSLGNWLVDAAAVVLILERAFSFWKNHLREQPPPGATYVAKEDCQRINLNVSAQLAHLEEQNLQAESRRRAIYEQIDKVRREIKSDIQRMEDQIRQTPDAVIRLLKETGVL